MNHTEREMMTIIEKIKSFGYEIAIKAEFEAEGTRTDELLRLMEITYRSNTKLALKIGGCEAVRDLLEAKQFGVNYIIAPMVETEYALKKFIDAKNKIYTADEKIDTKFLVNIETDTGYDNRQDIANLACTPTGIDGIVFGRVDFAGSLGLSRESINKKHITNCGIALGSITNKLGLELVVGGGVSFESVPALNKISKKNLSRFETRKIVFDQAILDDEPAVKKALFLAVQFECLWLKNKQDYYQSMANEDVIRLKMLTSRYNLGH
jgi:hypothetical protein